MKSLEQRVSTFLQGDALAGGDGGEPDALAKQIASAVPPDRLNAIRVIVEKAREKEKRRRNGNGREKTVMVNFYDERTGDQWAVEFVEEQDRKAWRRAWQERMEEAGSDVFRHGPK